MALAALLPLWIAVGIGHLAPMLLLVLAGGLTLHKQGKRGWAGLVLSLLALKPQLAAGLLLWMLFGATSARCWAWPPVSPSRSWPWPCCWDPACGSIICTPCPRFPPLPAPIAIRRFSSSRLRASRAICCGQAGLTAWQVPAMRIAYAVTASAAAVMLCRVVWAREAAGSREPPQSGTRRRVENMSYEYACGVLFMMILPPYFLVYDQTLLAVPLVMLWSSPAWRWGVALFATVDGIGGQRLVHARIQPHRVRGPGGDVFPGACTVHGRRHQHRHGRSVCLIRLEINVVPDSAAAGILP